jgi:gas vesicle protein
MLQTVQSGISDIVNERKKKKNADQLYKAITTVLAVTTDIALPIIEIVIFFLPDLLSGIFKQRQQQQQKEQIRNTILTQLIPSIKRELRTKLPEIFNQQVQEVIVSISNNFESAIQEKQETIATTQRDIESKIADTEQTIAEYKDVNAKILVLANNTLFV